MAGGYFGTGVGEKESNQVTEAVTRGAAAGYTFGASEIPVGGQSLGSRAADKAKAVNSSVHRFFRNMDPTNTSIPEADRAGVQGAQAAVGRSGSTAANLARAIMANPTGYQAVNAPPVAAASQIAAPAQVAAERVAAGQAQAMMIDPAPIAAVERVQAAQLARGDEQAVRARQMQLAQALEAQAAGTAPSLAEMQLARQNEQAMRQQLALAASQRGITPAMAQRQAAQNIGMLAAEQGQRAAELRIQEQQAARAQLADVLGQTRGVDVSLAGQEAQLAQQAGLANASAANTAAGQQAQLIQQAALANQGEFGQASRFNVGNDLQAATTNAQLGLQAQTTNVGNQMQAGMFNAKAADEMARFQADAGLRASIANQAADLQAKGMDDQQIARMLGIEQESLRAVLSSETEMLKAEQARLQAQKEASSKGFGNILGAAGSVVSMLSDITQKRNIKSADKDMRDFVDALSANTYEYKDPGIDGAAPGRRYGIMAQHLERSKAGKSIVMDTPDGKKVDVQQGLGVALAALAAMNKRLGKVEGKRA